MGLQMPNTAQNGPSLSTNVLDYLQPYTMMCWAYITTGGVFSAFGCVGNNTTGQINIDYFEMSSSSQYNLAACDAVGILENAGSSVVLNKWQFFAMVRNSNTDLRLYLGDLGKNAVQDISNTRDVSARLATRNYMSWGNDGPDLDNGNMVISYGKAWQAALTPQEIIAEQFVAAPVRRANLYGFWPFRGAVSSGWGQDESGNRNHMSTITGTLTSVSDPPIPWALPSIHWIPAASGVPVTLEQEGYRFRNDDGSETTATWLASQDTPASIAQSTRFRLRTLINASGDPPSKAYRIEYRTNNSNDWRKVQ